MQIHANSHKIFTDKEQKGKRKKEFNIIFYLHFVNYANQNMKAKTSTYIHIQGEKKTN